MSERVLVTGGTGTLGRVVVERLSGSGAEVRVLSRRTGGDLLTGRGLAPALSDVDTVIHCATTQGSKDLAAAGNLIAATAGDVHLVYISIVGVDRIPLGYYRTKLAVESLIAGSGRPFTILRTTQFHDLLVKLFDLQKGPFVLVPKGFRFQPIDTSVVADRLVELAQGPARGRVGDMGGPHVQTGVELAEMYLRAKGSRRRPLSVPLPGRTARAFREGHHLSPANGSGPSFKDFLDLHRT